MKIVKIVASMISACLQHALNDPLTKTILDFLENFRDNLNEANVSDLPEDSRPHFFLFMDGIRASHYYHLKRSEISSFTRNFSLTLSYLLAWLVIEKQIGIINYGEVLARFKSVISDLRKILDKSFESPTRRSIHEKEIEELTSNVRDRIGIRLILDTADKNILFAIWSAVIDIIGGLNPVTKSEFVSWYKANPHIPRSHKRIIKNILDVPFSVSHYKNYVDFPKTNGYQSLQGTFSIHFYSTTLPGLQFELQMRTKEMDEIAVFGSASHQVYKQNNTVHKIISVADPAVKLKLKKGLEDYIPLCHCFISRDGKVELRE